MREKKTLIESVPEPVKRLMRPLYNSLCDLIRYKYTSELRFWKSRLEIDNGVFENSHYRKLMLGMAQENDDNFLRGKIVADFGCGPRGSLVWADSASLRIGIDVLADCYAELFYSNIISHVMMYVKSTEKVIPIASNSVDILFSLNAMDHVYDFRDICKEVIRIIKPGGDFICSFNLEEPRKVAEPQRLTERIIHDNLLAFLDVKSYRITKKGPEGYAPFFEGNLSYKKGEPGYLWVRATKPKIMSSQT